MDNTARLEFIKAAVNRASLEDLALPSTATKDEIQKRRDAVVMRLENTPSVAIDTLTGAMHFTERAREHLAGLPPVPPPTVKEVKDAAGNKVVRKSSHFDGG